MAAAPHALVIPFPLQSHILCHLELSYCLIDRGFKVTFLNTEFNHARLLTTLSPEQAAAAAALKMVGGVRLATVPDGLGPAEDREDLDRYTMSIMATFPGYLEGFMARQASGSIEERFTCVISDQTLAGALDVAKKAGLRTAAFFPAAAAVLAGNLSIPKLIEDGIIDENGTPKQHGMFQLHPEMIRMNPTHLFWNCFKDSKTNKIMFDNTLGTNKTIENADRILCNSFYELEKSVFTYAPNIVPIGPLLTGSRPNKTFGNFLVQDTKSIEWLDKHKKNSVIYAAFGSFTTFSKCQLLELALGLELSGHPFLWVVRPDLTSNDSDFSINLSGLIERVGERGRVVEWCPQQQVLAHPSIACFISHCGWNSTLEGVKNGVPFLCWPYFSDQFFNQSYICDVWRVGLRIMDDEKAICSKEQTISKLEKLIGDIEIRERSSALKEMACKNLERGGTSFANFTDFVDWVMGG